MIIGGKQIVSNKDALYRLLKAGLTEIEVSEELFNLDLQVDAFRIASGKSKQISKDTWVFDKMEYFIQQDNES